MLIKRTPDTIEKLKILSQDSVYDLACACGTDKCDHRIRSKEDKWIYPVTMQDGRRTFLFKTLISNICLNTCNYCPLRITQDPRRCSLLPEEMAKTFLQLYKSGKVSGLFVSSGLSGTPDNTMEKINATAEILRNNKFRGYIHLKIMPGSSDAAIEKAVSLASAVSLNIETAGENHFKKLGTNKDYLKDIVRPIKKIGELTSAGGRYARVKHTTQFIVGASTETDRDIVEYSWGLYKRIRLDRIYFSAYQRGLGEANLPGETSRITNRELLIREHRLYQADWLIRKYGFKEKEIPFNEQGNLHIDMDPKEAWAKIHPEYFPVNINKAGREELLRVPGFGSVTVDRILENRKTGRLLTSILQLGCLGKRWDKAVNYITI